MKRKITRRLIVHHSASNQVKTTIDDIRRWHKEKGLTDDYGHGGYHYFIDYKGNVIADRPEDEWGANVKNANQDSIGICLAGDFRKNEPSQKQINALIELLIKLVKKYNLKYWNIYGHRDIKWLFIFNSTVTDCPGDRLYNQLPNIRRRVAMALLETKRG